MTGPAPYRRNSPYQGLIPYSESDAGYFFGREKETRLIVANLFASPLTLLYGASGVGKSSVLRAGVASELHRRPNLRVIIQSDWKNNPLVQLKTLVGSQAGRSAGFETDRLLGDDLLLAVEQTKSRLMIVLDQFEEYFFYHPVEDEFTHQFSQAVLQTGLPASFLISIREDALAKLDRFEGRIPTLFDNYLRLDHLDDSAARIAIEKPVEQYNQINLSDRTPIRIEKELVDEVLNQLKTGRVSLHRTGPGTSELDRKDGRIETPYLQLVMTRIWEQEMAAKSSALRLATLKDLGGAEKIVKTHLDSIMKKLSSDYQLLASQIFQYLVTPSGTKIALNASDLATFVSLPMPVVRSLLQRLADKDVRLLRAVDTGDKTGTSYEIFHDVLASPILDWRERWVARYNLKRRSTMFVLLLFFVFAATFTAGIFWLSTDQANSSLMFTCFLPVMVLALIFGMVGFLAGMNWARTR